MSNTFTGWAIGRDYLDANTPHSRVGYGQRQADAEETTDSFNRVIGRTVYVSTELSAANVTDPVRFGLLDSDDEVYYGGAISRDWIDGEEEFCFAPLVWAEADAGCTELQYHYGDGVWQTL